MLRRTLRMALWVTYDHLGKLVLANIVWAVAIVLPASYAATAIRMGDAKLALAVGVPVSVLTIAVILPVMSVGIGHMVAELIDVRDGSLRAMFTGIALYWRRATKAGAYASIIATIVTWFIFFAMSGFGGEYTVLGGVMPVAICWLAGAVAMVAVSLATKPPSDEVVAKFFP